MHLAEDHFLFLFHCHVNPNHHNRPNVTTAPSRAAAMSQDIPEQAAKEGCARFSAGIALHHNLPRRELVGRTLLHAHRVTGGGRPPPVPTERSVQISRTTLFGRCFTALQEPATPHMGGAALVSVTASLL